MKGGTGKRKHPVRRTVLIIIVALILGAGLYIYYNYFVVELRTLKLVNGTSVSAAMQSEKTFLRRFKDRYPELSKYLSRKNPRSYVIPGLVQAKNVYAKGPKKGHIGYATDMTPQGVTVTKDYLLISAYSKSKKFHSVIWVMNRDSGEFIKTIVLKGTDHVGGMAYDKAFHRLWITAVKKGMSNAMIGYLSLDEIEQYDFDAGDGLAEYDERYALGGLERTSYLTLHDHVLYAGYFTKKNNGTLCKFPLDEDGIPELSEEEEDGISLAWPSSTSATPNRIQGLTYYNDAIVLSQSYGPKHAHFMIYPDPGEEALQNLTDGRLLLKVSTPPYLEQTWADGDDFYALFESSASSYRERSGILFVDRVLRFDFSSVENSEK